MSRKKSKDKKKSAAREIAAIAPERIAKAKKTETASSAAVRPAESARKKAAVVHAGAARNLKEAKNALQLLEGRWKLLILAQLKGDAPRRFSELERAIPAITQKMLGQQLRQLEADGLVIRTVYPQVPPRVEYRLTPWGQALGPALDALVAWSQQRPKA